MASASVAIGVAAGAKEPAWNCHKCFRHNPLRNVRCPTCQAWKGQRTSRRPMSHTSTKRCEIVQGVERHRDECALCELGGGETMRVP